MHIDAVLRKTDRACLALQTTHALPQRLRQFLLMVDGQKSLRELSPAAKAMGVDHAALAAMVNRGLVERVGDTRAMAA